MAILGQELASVCPKSEAFRVRHFKGRMPEAFSVGKWEVPCGNRWEEMAGMPLLDKN